MLRDVRLTPREGDLIDVYRPTRGRITNKELAVALGVSEAQIEYLWGGIYRALGIVATGTAGRMEVIDKLGGWDEPQPATRRHRAVPGQLEMVP